MSAIRSVGRARPLSAEVVAQIESLIVAGKWQPGERLPAEPALATQLGVSRSVVRDAIRTLTARGLVEVRQGIGTTVSDSALEAYADSLLMLLLRSEFCVGDLFDARATIESGVVVSAARNRTDEDCFELRRHVELMAEAVERGDWRAAFAEDLSFHRAVIRATGLPALIVILEPLHHVIASSLLVPDVGKPELFDVPDHERICRAIVARDVDEAARAMTAHFSSRDDPAFQALYSTPCKDLAVLAQQIRDSRARSFGMPTT
jgi:GntR family transcriptional regulator, transcriptional repressor for pyruvate dehydrogenase complex